MQQSKPKVSGSKKQANQSNGIIRIIGGSMRGRKLRFSTVDGLRPTLDRVRETLFNWISQDVAGATCLDLFSGSGALGFESVSRGAAHLTMVEKSAKVSQNLKKNCQLLNLENVQIYNQSYELFLKKNSQQFNLVFLDPPFGKKILGDIEEKLTPHLSHGALIYIEQEKSEESFKPSSCWLKIKYKSTGSLIYALYRYSP
ncbi:16S rRNA (guanine(966)-N(2))-methyltransferase RsmD [Aliikangiella sp. IMCC44359]|uniref:16S rRNA (guanine(966)-N(2))-methyltransferase RsmD n=1 Tax=Aliikangiella sp. IMCC44359 TaxID=3459125 RepID=UPI00403AE812